MGVHILLLGRRGHDGRPDGPVYGEMLNDINWKPATSRRGLTCPLGARIDVCVYMGHSRGGGVILGGQGKKLEKINSIFIWQHGRTPPLDTV